MKYDYLGNELPAGYKRWVCPTCDAGCNFEAMQQCGATLKLHPDATCGFDMDKPESNFDCFAFIKRIDSMEFKFAPEHLDLVKEQVWECKEDLSLHSRLTNFETNLMRDYLPEHISTHFEFGAGMGRGAISIDSLYASAPHHILADRQGRTKNEGIFYPEEDEYYNDFDLTDSFCTLNGLTNFSFFDTEKSDWNKHKDVDLITSRCSLAFHVPLDRYQVRLYNILRPGGVMILGANKNFDPFKCASDINWTSVEMIGTTEGQPGFPHENFWVFKK